MERGPNRRDVLGPGEVTLKEPAVAADDFVHRVTGHALEPLVRVDERLIDQTPVLAIVIPSAATSSALSFRASQSAEPRRDRGRG